MSERGVRTHDRWTRVRHLRPLGFRENIIYSIRGCRLETVKGNAVFISRSDLENVQTYLISLKNGVSSDIAFNLKRIIKQNKVILSSFPSADDCVCVLEASTEKEQRSQVCV